MNSLDKVRQIFSEALDKATDKEQKAYLEKVCKGNPSLQAEVEALLKAHSQSESFLESPILDSESSLMTSPISESPGTVIGRYTLLEKIGEGGMAVVYSAQQEKPIQRKVAIKIIKLGMDTKQVIGRFDMERQALALMDHQNIAKIHDAGATETGRPYFVMELVEGKSITEYCDKNNLTTKERLDLFISVCNAVQHAHQKGIIHRDIKPTNVLVTVQDNKPIPKVIDFGIAKATGQQLTEKTVFTRYAQMIGTPEYMSPEQAETGGIDIDTRTDIYSLGVLLYELLTGVKPFDPESLREAGYGEIQRIIREEEPDKPSTRLSTLGDTLTDVAQHRMTEPNVLRKLLKGDLDWIVMKALEKDRTRRYEDADELAEDIKRHFEDEPVLAGPPEAGYRLGKFIRRNRVYAAACLLIIGSLLVGGAAVTITVLNSDWLTGPPKHATGMVERHIWNAPSSASLLGGLSADGRYMSYVDWTAGDLGVYDVEQDRSWLVTNNIDWDELNGWNESSAVSGDGRQIAYAWCNEKDVDFYDLRIIDVGGSNMRILYHDAATFWINVYGWSPDGKNILAYFSNAEKNLTDERTGELFREGYLVLVSVDDGSVRKLKTWREFSGPKKAFFSPDGRYIAYDFGQENDLNRNDIYMIDLEGGIETQLVDHAADDWLSGWMPDGKTILFTSNRTSSYSLWMIKVANGSVESLPRLLKGKFDGFPIGSTVDGSYYYSVQTSTSDVVVGSVDSESGEFTNLPKPVNSQFVGKTNLCDWSSNGEYLVSRTKVRSGLHPDGDLAFLIHTIATGDEQIIMPTPRLSMVRGWNKHRLSPNGRSLLVFGFSLEYRYGLYTVDMETGGVTLVVSNQEIGYPLAEWSPDGESIYFYRGDKFVRYYPDTGEETELAGKHWGGRFDISPDGEQLAFYQNKNSLVIIPSEGGQVQEVATLQDEEMMLSTAFVRWTPDGNHLLFSRNMNQLSMVNVTTGQEQQIGPEIKGLVDAAMQPGGDKIALTVKQNGSQLWVIENFLPEL